MRHRPSSREFVRMALHSVRFLTGRDHGEPGAGRGRRSHRDLYAMAERLCITEPLPELGYLFRAKSRREQFLTAIQSNSENVHKFHVSVGFDRSASPAA
jgi:hypothetical protein